MSKIVLSYRRSDSQAVAGRIADRLIAYFGADSVFMDVDNIPFGIDFRLHIKAALSQAEVLIAVVGPGWLGAGTDSRTRIDDDDDPVRVEIETALQQKLLVIPVLVNGASMPKSDTLPVGIRDFAFLNAAPVDDGRDFRPHADRLIQSIESALASRSYGPQGSGPDRFGRAGAKAARSPRATATMIRAAVVAVLLLLGAGAAWRYKSSTSQYEIASAPSAVALPPAQAGATAGPGGTPAPGPVTGPQPVNASADDIRWDLLKDTTDVGLLRRFAEQNPDSRHRAEAEQRIAILAVPSPPTPSPVVPMPAASQAASDDGDWNAAKASESYEAYEAYAKAHPQGRHVSEARRDAIAGALKAEPPIGTLPFGATVLVDDHSCQAKEIKAVTGGDVSRKISRTKRCLPRDGIF
jgi:hypothetical protein